MAWGDPDREDSDALEFSLFRSLSPNRVQKVSENFVEPVVFADEDLRPALEAYGAVSFGCGLYDDDILSTAASESEDLLADTCGSLPPGGQERRSSPSYSELLDMVTRVVDKLGLDWEADAAQSQSKLDDRFLTSRAPAQPRKPLPFFPDLHQEVRRWKRLWLNISRRTRPWLGSLTPLLPSKPCRITSSLVGKSYSAAGQAAATLHSMAVLQAYQAELLKELDKGEGITPEAVKELRWATDLALRATKHTARAVGRSMAGMVTVERHLWKRVDLSSTTKTSRPQAPSSSSWPLCCLSGTVPSTRERCWTAKVYPTLSLQSPGSKHWLSRRKTRLEQHWSEPPLWAPPQTICALQPSGFEGRPKGLARTARLWWPTKLPLSGTRYASCWNESCRKHFPFLRMPRVFRARKF